MTTFFDTSALLAALIDSELAHAAAFQALSAGGATSSHCLAECFANLTGGRLGLQLTPREAAELVEESLHRRLEIITLSPAEIISTLHAAGPSGARGGAIYDLLILAAARKSRAARILTLNVRHFAAFAPDLKSRIRHP